MKKLATIILSAICLSTVSCMDIPDVTCVESTQISIAPITKEHVLQAWEELGDREDFWDIRRNCEATFVRATSRDTLVLPEKSIDLLKEAFCGSQELGIRAYVDQEEQRFMNFIDSYKGNIVSAFRMQQFRQFCIEKQGFDFNFILNIGLIEKASNSLLIYYSKTYELKSAEVAIFWYLVSTADDNTIPSCQDSARYCLQRLKELKR